MTFGKLILTGFLLACVLIQTACVSTNKAIYFADQKDTVLQSSIISEESVIHSNDLLSISVSSLDPLSSALFNAPNISGAASTTASGASVQANGYLVNSEGYIKFPFLGKVKASGLTENQLSENITESLLKKKLLIDPIVNIRHLNFKITVLGEVNHPSVFTVPDEKISLLEAIGLAGDLTIYAKRKNVLLIREESGQKITKRINLNSNELFDSPYYYLKSNDVVYVEPNKTKVSSVSRGQQLLPVILSGLSFAVIIIDRITR
jgi:polysaccharide export outer membrane protein